jgi:hypothetical protein
MSRTLVKNPVVVEADSFAAAPVNTTTQCESYVRVTPTGPWVPSSVIGPVDAVQDPTGANVYCWYHGPNPPATDDGKWRWWWDYLRGRWPSYQQPRIIAGSSINGQQDEMVPAGNTAVVYQRVYVGNVIHIERVYMLEGSGSVTVQTTPSAEVLSSTVTLVANTYTEVQADGTLSAPAIIGGANPGDMADPGYFAQERRADAVTRHLTDAFPCT